MSAHDDHDAHDDAHDAHGAHDGHDAHDSHDSHDDGHGDTSSSWVLAPLLAGLVIGLALAVIFGLGV